jgi:hypothetical protein
MLFVFAIQQQIARHRRCASAREMKNKEHNDQRTDPAIS